MKLIYLKLAVVVVEELQHDNGCKFDFAPELFTKIAEGLADMEASGIVLTDQVLRTLAQGDDDAVQHRLYTREGYTKISDALEDIFISPVVLS